MPTRSGGKLPRPNGPPWQTTRELSRDEHAEAMRAQSTNWHPADARSPLVLIATNILERERAGTSGYLKNRKSLPGRVLHSRLKATTSQFGDGLADADRAIRGNLPGRAQYFRIQIDGCAHDGSGFEAHSSIASRHQGIKASEHQLFGACGILYSWCTIGFASERRPAQSAPI